MDSLQSKGLVRRILSLTALLGALILLQGSGPSHKSRSAPAPTRPAASAKKVPSPPVKLPPLRRDFPNFYGQSSALFLVKDEVHVYSFDLEPGDFVDIEVKQQGLDVVAEIKGPGTQPPVEVDRLNGDSGPENIPLLAEVAGRYKVELRGGGDGTYQILVPPKHKATARDRQNAAGALAYSRGSKTEKTREAEQEFRKALAFWEASGFRAGQADAAYHLQNLLPKREALPILEKASALYDELGNYWLEAIVRNDLGFARQALGDRDKALSSYDSALALVSKAEKPKTEASILFNRGRLYSEEGELEKALQDLEKAVAIRRTLSNPTPSDLVALAEALNALGRAYYIQNELDKALRLHHEAEAILKNSPSRYVAGQTLLHLGDIHRKKGEFNRAISQYALSLNLLQGTRHPREEAIALNNLALAYFEAGLHHEALSAFQRCQREFKAVDDTDSVAKAWSNMGWVLGAMKRNTEASDAYRQALAMSQGKRNPFLEMASYYGLAQNEWQRGNLVRAQEFLTKSLSAMESIRSKAARADLRSSFLAGKQDIYDLLVEVLMDQHRREPAKGYDLKAFEASEKARSRRLVEDLEGRIMVPTVSVQNVQNQVLGTGDTVLLEYFLGRQRSYLWVVTSSSFTSYEIPASRAQVEKLSQEVHDLLEVSHKFEKRKFAIRKSIELSRLLFGQVANRLEGKKLLIVAPPELQYVTFGALPEDLRESVQRGTEWPRPWILDHEITVELSATVLGTLRRLNEGQEPPSGLIAVLADPVYSLDDERMGSKRVRLQPGKEPRFPRLHFSRKEVQAIMTTIDKAGLGNAKRLIAMDFDTNRQQVLDGKLKDFRYLHFSAHGELDDTTADRSAIVLSLVDREGKSTDGFLRAGEIAKLELSSDLVVLSACQTGLGRKIRGEGLVGLTQAFFSAGAPRVMVSLWNVDDQATAELMSRFYRELLQRHLSPAAALKEAEVSMWRQPRWNAPSYWGGFVLQGEWR
ncbi:MAG TPA: CHAT domain-containing tetratricopeptide repeat protein [Thermoanaerobaculia bacterium]|jgi:CHAT domain-containing protein|nr:CHAT domain-containing tetratricopeptide repeat protein [Thermoanaerobaculia bacterium]